MDPERDGKYPAFRRQDIAYLNRPWLYLSCPFMVLRLVMAFFVLFVCGMVCSFIVMTKPDNKPLQGWRYFVNRAICWCASWAVTSSVGITWFTTIRPKICYKKYLGQ